VTVRGGAEEREAALDGPQTEEATVIRRERIGWRRAAQVAWTGRRHRAGLRPRGGALLAAVWLAGMAAAPGAQETPLRALPARESAGLTRAEQRARHAAFWEHARACLIDPPPGPARPVAVAGAPPRRVSPYADQSVAGLPAVAVVEGQVTAVTSQLTAGQRGVFTDYELTVERVVQQSTVLPVPVGGTLVVTRPGGQVVVGGQRRVVSVTGYPALAVGARVVVTLVAIPDAESYQEASLRPSGQKER